MENLKQRTKTFSLRVIRMVERLPDTRTALVLGNQLLRSGTSVGANYRAACRARSGKEFIARLGIAEEEADESLFWMELLEESGTVKAALLRDLKKETDELISIFVASSKTAKKSTPRRPPNPASS